MHRTSLTSAIAVVASLLLAGSAAAQQTVSDADIQRLQDQVFQASSEVSRLRSTDSTLASRLETELDDLREEVIYLKVKNRKEGPVNRSEYADLRDRLQDLRTRARGEARGSRAPSGGVQGGVGSGVSGGTAGGVGGGVSGQERGTRTSQGSRGGIPVGQEIDVRLMSQLSSDTAQVEDRFEATTMVDMYEGNNVVIPAGSLLRGVVSSVDRASRTDRKGSLTVSFDQITVDGRNYPMRGTVTQALESEGMRGEAGRIGAGAGVGAIIGGILGGVKGALLGVLIGGGGTIAATEGKDVTLPAGTILRVRLDTPPNIR
jgi:outer membrane murein-binding lipoprotein Lpp